MTPANRERWYRRVVNWGLRVVGVAPSVRPSSLELVERLFDRRVGGVGRRDSPTEPPPASTTLPRSMEDAAR